jgi:hypothetical protein
VARPKPSRAPPRHQAAQAMNKTSLLFTALGAALLSPAAAHAAKADNPKNNPVAHYDTNKNGKLDPEEYAAVRKDFVAKPQGPLAKLDTNHDGTLSDDELAAYAAPAPKREKSDAERAERRAKRQEKKKP